jgi:HlyD family secretion protein
MRAYDLAHACHRRFIGAPHICHRHEVEQAMTKPIVIAAVIAALAASAWTARAFRDPGVVQVTSAPVTKGPIARAIVATGTLQPTATVQVGAQVSGTIATINVDYNSIVRKGDVLATIDPAQLDAELRGAEAALAVAQATLDGAVAARAGLATAVVDADTKLSREESLAARELVPGAASTPRATRRARRAPISRPARRRSPSRPQASNRRARRSRRPK